MPLVVVPTPLGNLGDITVRALDVLRNADLLVAEDTRVSRKLLSHFAIPRKELWTYTEHRDARAADEIVKRASVQTVALISDAGMPGISDPGSALIARAREDAVAVEVLPGPAAFVGAAVLSGFALRRFSFEGFFPRAAGERDRALGAALARGCTSVWYESPQRVGKTLRAIATMAPDLRVFLLREYTKLHEQQLLGTAAEVAAQLADPVRGEICIVLDAPVAASAPDAAAVDRKIEALLATGVGVSVIAKQLAGQESIPRRTIYRRALALAALQDGSR